MNFVVQKMTSTLTMFVILVGLSCLAGCEALRATPDAQEGASLRIATWNIEHFGEIGEGCVPRTEADVAATREFIKTLDADVLSFQEVASEGAASTIFPQTDWQLFISRRVYDRAQPQCRQDTTKTMGHMRTGFAVRRGIVAKWMPELATLGDTAIQANDEPHGVDILVGLGGQSVRLLSVHLTSGCSEGRTETNQNCRALFSQVPALRSWVEAREASGEQWIIAGDFNRFWQPEDTFWVSALGPRQMPPSVISSSIKCLPSEACPRSVDHIIVSPASTAKRSARVRQSVTTHAFKLSDHDPVVAIVDLDPSAAADH